MSPANLSSSTPSDLERAWRLERVVRPLLELMQHLTGLETTFMTRIDWVAQTQTVELALNTSALEVAEGLVVNWHDTMCRRTFLEGKPSSSRVSDDFPGHPGAVELGLETFFAIPVVDGADGVLGTVCGASLRSVELSEPTLRMLRLVAEAVACQLEMAAAAVAAEQRAERAEELAVVDPLTGLTNRRGFEAHFEEQLAQSGRHGFPVALLLFDVDNFKGVNDTYGHLGGDEVLRVLAEVLQSVPAAGRRARPLGW